MANPLSMTLLLAVAIATCAYGQGDNCQECKAVLAGGVFNTTNINQTQAAKDAFNSWECTTEFTTSQQALDAGVSIGVPIYGVPVKIGGTFSDDQRKSWKKDHCASTSNSSQSFSTLIVAIRQAAPEILSAWTKCIENTCGPARTALSCSVTSTNGGAIFKANWLRNAGDNAVPQVQFFKAYDAACIPPIKGPVSVAGVVTNCKIPVNKEAVFILQTDRGICTPTASGTTSVETLSGRTILTAPRHIKAEKIVVASDALVVTNGNRLTLEAAEIVIQGSPKIVAFDTTDATGRSADAIVIKTATLSGTSLEIDNSGQKGVPGTNGANGIKGPNGNQGTQRDWNAFNGCIGGSNGTPGGTGSNGADGTTGGTGGNGGAVIFDVSNGIQEGPVRRLLIRSIGGLGGDGGQGGAAGPGGDGGAGAPGTFHCGGTGPGPGGAPGQPGRLGPPGAPGAAGQVVDYRAN